MNYRLSPILGEWIDRTQTITFTFEGRTYSGYQGDTITSALYAAGQRILGRSFKYHRPRSVLSLANHDVNVLMQDGQRLNIRADVTPLEAGMNLTTVNTFGGVMGDRASVIDFFAAFLPVGFYYKAFHNKKLFPFWERQIRRMTGLGQVDVTTPHLRTAKRYDFCDVLVIGAGISGLSAALAAAEAGAEVVIVDENARAGGAGSYQIGDRPESNPASVTLTMHLVAAVTSHPNIRLYTETIAAAYYADHWVPLVRREYLVKMRAKAVILASGAYEQPAVFRNNDLPGVMLSSAAQRLIYRYAVKPMHRAVVLTANQDGYRAALDLVFQGIEVKAIVELRSQPSATEALIQKIRSCNIPILVGYCIYEARSNPANDGVSAAVVCPLDWNGNPQLAACQSIACDGILMSVGWAPAANLLYQAGARMSFDTALQQFVPTTLPTGVFACGRVNGVFAVDQKRVDGQRAGIAAVQSFNDRSIVRATTESLSSATEVDTWDELMGSPSHPYPIFAHPQSKNFVDFDEDLQLKDFLNAYQEGFDNIELLKRYTTVGMGPSQGKHSNMNALRILARITGKTPDEVGTTTARPFFHPIPMSHLAGRGFMPERTTPLHDRHAALNAKFMPVGLWQRPEYYQQADKHQDECVRSEVQAVRTRVGLIDVGTLGKLEIWGTDAAEFLERVYTGRFQNQKIGMTRYAVMLDEAGTVMDDGVVARLAAEQFYFTTTTAGATVIYRELTRLNTVWQLDCGLVNLTGARSAVNLAGPYARQVLAQLTDLDLSVANFPYLAVREAEVAGIAAVLMRVGFVGEWGYEIHVAAEAVPALWDALMAAGADYGIQPFGVAAQRLLRLEKGHLIIGQDTDGLTTPIAANLNWAVKLDKPFFVGQRSLQILRQKSPKQVLVGFVLEVDDHPTPPQECQLILEQGEIAGRVTSVAFSPTLQRYIGLAYVPPNLAEVGTRFVIRCSDRATIGAIVHPIPFYDPDNARQKEPIASQQEVMA
jgi:sarcosine oxidase subunit alpha